MPWSQDQLDKLRDKLTLAKRAGLWLTAGEIGIVLELIRFWRRQTTGSGFFGPAEGMIPTIAHVKEQGVTSINVECVARGCGNRRKLSFEELGVPDDVVFVEISKHRGFRCWRCNGRAVTITANHPNPIEQQRKEVMGE